MISLKAARCPSCGADIEVNPELEKSICQFCGSTILIQDAIAKIKVEHSGTIKVDGIQGESDLIELAKKHIQFNRTDNALDVIEEVLKSNSYNMDALYLYLKIYKDYLLGISLLDSDRFPDDFRKLPFYYNTFKTRLNYLKELDKEGKYPTEEYYNIINRIEQEVAKVNKKDSEKHAIEMEKYSKKEAIKEWTIRIIRFGVFPIIAFSLVFFDEDRNEFSIWVQIGVMLGVYAVEYLLTRRLFNWILDRF